MSDLLNAMLIASFLSFPQAILILEMGFGLCGITLCKHQILIISFFQSIVAFIVKLLNIPFGWHTIVQVMMTWLLVLTFLCIKAYQAAVPVLIGVFIDGIMQAMFFPVVNLFHTLHFQRLGNDFIYTFKWMLPLFMAYILIVLIIKRKKLVIFDIKID